MNYLFLFPHQDDEVMVYPVIKSALRSGHTLYICYLTNGAPSGSPSSTPQTRNQESLSVLKRWGVSSSNVSFIGTNLPIVDGTLHQNSTLVLEQILKSQQALLNQPLQLWTPDWEGGHPDHDSAFKIGVELRAMFNHVEHHSFSLYRMSPLGFPFFVMGSLIAPKQGAYAMPIGWLDKFEMLGVLRLYKSQIKTWLKLTPFLILFFIFNRKVHFRKANYRSFPLRPHPGPLLYEKLYHVPFQSVAHTHLLQSEFNQICTRTFGSEPPGADLFEEYVRGHTEVQIDLGAHLALPSYTLADKGVDLEALELVLRKKHPALRQKFLLCSYLLESRRKTLPLFLDNSTNKAGTYFNLVKAGISYIIKRIKGNYLKLKYGL